MLHSGPGAMIEGSDATLALRSCGANLHILAWPSSPPGDSAVE